MPVLKTLARGTVKLILGLLLLLAGFYLILLAINWQDAEPNAASLQLQSLLQQEQIPASQNGYQYYLAHNANRELLLRGPLQQLYGKCSDAQSCKELLIAQTDLAAQVAEQNQLMTFYTELLQYPNWQEPQPTLENMPAYQLFLHGQRLFLWQTWLDAQAGNSEQVKAALTADYKFWKNVLANNNTVIAKMISIAAVKHHFNLSTVIISQLPAEQRLFATPEGWDVAFSDKELGLELALAGEWYYGADITSNMRDAAPSDFGSDVNIVETAFYLLVQPLMLLEDTKNMYATQLVQWNKKTQHSEYSWYSWLRNPVGKMLMATGPLPYEDYQQRLLKLEQLRQDALQQVN